MATKKSGERVRLNVPFTEKDEAKALGAKWHYRYQFWYVPPGMSTQPFERWLIVPTVKQDGGVPVQVFEYQAPVKSAWARRYT
jgi:hypothetical protein